MKIFTILFITFLSLTGVTKAEDQSKNDQLYMAIQMQDTFGVLKHIVAGADVNYIDSGRPILAWAAQNENAFIVQSLIKAGAKPNQADEMGQTPLMRAIDTQHVNIVRVLLKAKADPNAKDAQGESCLIMAVKSRKPEIVQALINAGADVNGLTPDGDSPALVAAQDGMPESYEIIRMLGSAKANMNLSNIIYTPLSYAIDQGNKDLVQALLSAGADANAKTQSGTIPIQRALDNKEILELLLKAKADPNTILESGSTPLIQSIENGNTDTVKLLLEAGANPLLTGTYGGTPIEVAEQYSRPEISELLKAHLPKENNPSQDNKLAVIPADLGAPGCTIVDAAKMQMEIHGLLQAQVDAGKMSSEIFRTFNDDTKDYGEMLTRNPPEACELLRKLRVKYGV